MAMSDTVEQGAISGATLPTLLRHVVVHFGAAVGLLCMFAACDSWSSLTGWAVALVLSVLTGFVAGFATTTVLHEWGHLLGAWLFLDLDDGRTLFGYHASSSLGGEIPDAVVARYAFW